MYRTFIKRFFDITISFIGLIILLIPMAIICFIIKVDNKGPAIFCQKRLGKDKKIFTMYKLRSMIINDYSDAVIISNENDSRITRVGRILRKTSIDELPQLINILLGDMSIIGPRPMLIAEYEEYKTYIDNIDARFSVRPGLFCTVDVKYRAEASIQQQMDFDEKYINNITFRDDAKCFVGVLGTVLSRKNVYSMRK